MSLTTDRTSWTSPPIDSARHHFHTSWENGPDNESLTRGGSAIGDGRSRRAGLNAPSFIRVANRGFGDQSNSYIHCMSEYGGRVYAGTSRNSMALLKLFPPPEPPTMDPWPVQTPETVQDLDMHGQIWRSDQEGLHWEKVHSSPEIAGKEGKAVPRDLGYRGMTVFQGTSDPEPALYVVSISTVLRGTAARLLRTTDGVNFEPVGEPGLGNAKVSTLRAMTGFDGHLFVPPAGEGITLNSNSASVIRRSADPATGSWTDACEPGFGDPHNTDVFEMAVFAEHLYAGTFNSVTGYQIWKTPVTGGGPCRWKLVVDRGAHRGRRNEIAMSMCVFNDALYVGSAIQNGGYDRVNRVGPAAAELIRIHPDDSWDLVVGEEWRTPDGLKRPASGLGPGFDSIFAGYIWRLVEHDGWLYASTFDWSVFLPFAGNPSTAARSLISQFGADEIAGRAGGFELWRSQDGTDWVPVTQDGLGNHYNFGARTLVSTSRGLFLGTANPFGPMVAAKTANGWAYVPNADGGAEVWLGRTAELGSSKTTTRSRGDLSGVNDVAAERVLLTGGTGFIGSQLLDRLLVEVPQVRVLAVPDTLAGLTDRSNLEVVVGDLGDPAQLDAAVRDVDVIFHLAALLPGASPADLHAVNVKGTHRLLAACADSPHLKRFVLVSSTAVYSDAFQRSSWPLTEESPIGPHAPGDLGAYGWSKVAAEKLVRQSAANRGFEFCIVRPAACFAPGSPLVKEIRESANAGRVDGQSWILQPVHVADLLDLLTLAGTASAAAGETFHIAGSEAMSYGAATELLRDAMSGRGAGGPGRVDHLERWSFPYDLRKLRQVLGFIPAHGLRETLLDLAGNSRSAQQLQSRASRPVRTGRPRLLDHALH